jgi:hypothetical protein
LDRNQALATRLAIDFKEFDNGAIVFENTQYVGFKSIAAFSSLQNADMDYGSAFIKRLLDVLFLSRTSTRATAAQYEDDKNSCGRS